MSILALTGLVILGAMFLLWSVSLAVKDSSIVDIFWGPGFVIVAWLVVLQVGWSPRKVPRGGGRASSSSLRCRAS